jgi:Predicted pPIWI-associating nuclease
VLIEPQIAARHWEEAAIDQVAKDLEAAGYQVSRNDRLGAYRADLVARKNSEIIVYEFKVGSWNTGRAREAAALRKHVVHALGAQFKLVVVTPPRDKIIEVEDIEQLLLDTILENLPSELDQLSSHTRIEAVSDVNISSVAIGRSGTSVEGEGMVSVTLEWGSGDDRVEMVESFPFDFHIILGPQESVKDLISLAVDVSGWYGSEANTNRR